jgi:plastocyanin
VLTANERAYCFLLSAAAALGVFLSNAGPAAAAAPMPATHKVVIEGMRFDPPVLTVKVGDTILWVNHDPFPHTVTAQEGQFNSHEIAPGRSWRYTARNAGGFAYACTLHPTMVATLRVD